MSVCTNPSGRLEPLRVFEADEERRKRLESSGEEAKGDAQGAGGTEGAADGDRTSNPDGLQQKSEPGLRAPSLESGASTYHGAIIEYYDHAYFFIENPAGDALRGLHTRVVMKDLPEPLLTTYGNTGGVRDTSRTATPIVLRPLKLGERVKEENALAVMDLISALTARMDEHVPELQDTEAY
ncbi:hypothetical protein CYMTET_18996 [Cymbomonas tetramitiformis]|uniref:Uncharacterized protein n=1 Tax=Cymbomonas tetramitiformis TaxID=36881 RepID=A0AAE0G7L2_9CHLO|nr:hypothetical protein CYMTET_18996 [Cymbomonas tetramitiformis]